MPSCRSSGTSSPQHTGRIRPWLARFVLLCLALHLTAWASSSRAEFRAGVAIRMVTPDPLLPVSGGVGPSHPVTRKQGDLTVRSLVFDDGTTRVAIVAADFLGFPSVLGNKVRARITGVR